jgi:DNA-binding CsgD family transcriptional regulator
MSEIPKYHNEFIKLWEATEEHISEIKYAEQSKALGEYAMLNNQFIAVFNLKSQKIIYLSNNYLEIAGYSCSEEDYKRWSSLYWMRDLPIEQSWFFLKKTLFYRNTLQPIVNKSDDKPVFNWYVHNYKLKPPNSEVRHLSILTHALEFGKKGNLLVVMTIIKETGGFIKNKDTWWAEFRLNHSTVYHYHHLENKFQEGSIISDREKEVLLLVESGNETNEIAEKLTISPHTIDNHRKNMLERTGAKDISSLIQICRDGRIL